MPSPCGFRPRLRLGTFLGLVAVVAVLIAVPLERRRRALRRAVQVPAMLDAARQGDTDRIRKLIAEGADPDPIIISRSGWSPLMEAAYAGHVEAARLLIEHGADVNRRDADCFPVVNIAAYPGNWAMVRLLVEHGADPTIIDATGRSPIEHARLDGAEDMVQFLAEHGARPRPDAKP